MASNIILVAGLHVAFTVHAVARSSAAAGQNPGAVEKTRASVLANVATHIVKHTPPVLEAMRN